MNYAYSDQNMGLEWAQLDELRAKAMEIYNLIVSAGNALDEADARISSMESRSYNAPASVQAEIAKIRKENDALQGKQNWFVNYILNIFDQLGLSPDENMGIAIAIPSVVNWGIGILSVSGLAYFANYVVKAHFNNSVANKTNAETLDTAFNNALSGSAPWDAFMTLAGSAGGDINSIVKTLGIAAIGVAAVGVVLNYLR